MKTRLYTLIVMLCLASSVNGTLQAAPMQITINYELDLAFGATNPDDSILAAAFLDTSSLAGTGTEEILVDVFDLQFSIRAGTSNTRGQDLTQQTATITATQGVMARFQDGVFEHFFEFTPIGRLGLPVEPAAGFNGERIFLGMNGAGLNTLLDRIVFCSSCNKNYVQVGDVATMPLTPVPLPPGFILLASGLLALFSLRRRDVLLKGQGVA